eukprot:TRINITY_DN5176_c0_g1_i1.p1 TRINITY_DN5176_c0_g1~~TRINITY_DN5176_c0_g1_i1.p1  ORF type:complete len:347 (-),score=88.53 TRINITY_DN5176_c0_g1_i1:44-1084(-)
MENGTPPMFPKRFMDGPAQSEGDEETKRDPTDLENWYDKLKDYTFQTKFLDISQEEAQCIIDSYDDARHFDNKISSNPSKQETLSNLKNRLDQVIQSFGKEKGAFVRLSTRSPKDVVLKLREKVEGILKKELEDLKAGDDLQKQIVALVRAAIKCMKVHSGEEALDFLCKSERSYQDLFRRVLSHGDTKHWHMMIVIREWAPIEPEYEFRGFVSKGKMTGLTQYYKSCFVPEIYQNRKEILKRIESTFEKVKPLIPLESFTIDFAVNSETVFVVELNPFGPCSSPALFSWSEDNEILLDGPFQFRVLDSLPKNPKSLMAKPLREIMGWKDEEDEEKEKKKRTCTLM